MGRDKALLEMPGGELLWQRQVRTLEQLQPVEIFWSGFPRENLPPHLHVIADKREDAGPLAGVASCLDAMGSDQLVVLAVDLPQMTARYLLALIHCSKPGCGVVARRGDFFEPLAAVYPRELRGLAADHLQQGRNALQEFVREAVKLGFLEAVAVEEISVSLFKNVNTPHDL